MKVLSVLLAVVFLTSCSTTDSAYQEPTESVAPIQNSETLYLSAIRTDGGYMGREATDSELLELGYLACDAFDAGDTPSALIDDMMAQYGNRYDMRTFLASQIAASVAFLCPWHVGYDG